MTNVTYNLENACPVHLQIWSFWKLEKHLEGADIDYLRWLQHIVLKTSLDPDYSP